MADDAARSISRRDALGLTVAFGLVVAGCSDDSSSAPDSTVPATIELVPPPTTRPAATTTSTTVVETTTTTTTTPAEAVVAVFPLTGRPIPPGAEGIAARPAMVVKLDNHPKARPQSGLNEADIVFEENVENLTRFAAVFHSNGTDPVGPIRSGRSQDVDLLGSFNNPLFVWSGGNRRVADAIAASGFFQIDQNVGRGIMFRSNREGPHDLYADMTKLYALAPFGALPPAQQFRYRTDDDEPTGEPAVAAKVSMDGIQVLWQWDPTTATYLRFSDGKAHRDTVFDAQFSSENVIIVVCDYVPSPADARSPEAQTIGTGEVLVFSAGKLLAGNWSRADRFAPFVFSDLLGEPILLTPGRAVIELARVAKTAAVLEGVDPASIPYP